jgi:hypothetical protein
METEVHAAPEPSLTSLVTGIVKDSQDLLKQQVTLLREEIKEDVRHTKEFALSLAVGAGISLLGIVLLCWMLPYLLSWAVPALPLWACFGIVGTVFLVIGVANLYVGKKKLDSFKPVPSPSIEAIRENLKWTTMNRS